MDGRIGRLGFRTSCIFEYKLSLIMLVLFISILMSSEALMIKQYNELSPQDEKGQSFLRLPEDRDKREAEFGVNNSNVLKNMTDVKQNFNKLKETLSFNDHRSQRSQRSKRKTKDEKSLSSELENGENSDDNKRKNQVPVEKSNSQNEIPNFTVNYPTQSESVEKSTEPYVVSTKIANNMVTPDSTEKFTSAESSGREKKAGENLTNNDPQTRSPTFNQTLQSNEFEANQNVTQEASDKAETVSTEHEIKFSKKAEAKHEEDNDDGKTTTLINTHDLTEKPKFMDKLPKSSGKNEPLEHTGSENMVDLSTVPENSEKTDATVSSANDKIDSKIQGKRRKSQMKHRILFKNQDADLDEEDEDSVTNSDGTIPQVATSEVSDESSIEANLQKHNRFQVLEEHFPLNDTGAVLSKKSHFLVGKDILDFNELQTEQPKLLEDEPMLAGGLNRINLRWNNKAVYTKPYILLTLAIALITQMIPY